MPLLPTDWQFDLISFTLGLLVAALIFGVLLYSRARLAALRDAIWQRVARTRDRLTSGADVRYREDLTAALEQHHLAGSIVALDEIFIPTRFVAEQAPPDPGDEEFEPDITYVVPVAPDYPDLAALYAAPSHSLKDLARSESDLLLVGRQGGGRTTALVYLGLRAAQYDKDYFPQPVTPIFFHVGNLKLPLRKKDDAAQPLLDTVADQVGGLTTSGLQGYLRATLRHRRALLLMDGWDDLPAGQRADVLEWLTAFRKTYPGNRLIAAGPLRGYAALQTLGLVPVVMGGWTDDDYRRLVQRWVEAWPAILAAQRRRRRSDDDVDPALVAGWLSGGTTGRLPYDITLKIWTGLAGDAEGPRPVDWFSAYVKRIGIGGEVPLALEHAALDILKDGRPGLSRSALVKHVKDAVGYAESISRQDPSDLVADLTRPGGLLVKRADNLYTLSHPLTMGYLAARALTSGELPDPLVRNYKDEYWQVALRPFATLGDAGPIVAQMLNSSSDVLQAGLLTSAQWLVDAPSNAPWRNEVLRRLAQLLTSEQEPIALRGRALCAMVAARDEHVNQFFQKGLKAPDPLTRQYAAVGLGANRENTAVPGIAELMHDGDLYVRWAAALALATIGDMPALEALGTLLLEGDEHQRLAVGQVLALHPSEGHPMLRDAIEDQEVIVRRAAVLGLRRIGPEPWVIELLDDAFINDTQWIVRSTAEAAAEALKSSAPHPVKTLPTPDQVGWLVSWAAKHGGGVPPDSAGALRVMLQALREGEDEVRIAAAYYLGMAGVTEAAAALHDASRAESPDVRDSAYRALARLAWASGEQ